MSNWRILVVLMGLTLGQAVQAQTLPPDQEAAQLRAAGFPIIDVELQLDEALRQQLLIELEWLQICCDLDLIILMQDRSLLGFARADLAQLQQQLLRSNLWTEQTALLLIQSDPPLAELALASNLQADTTAISPAALAELGRQAGTPTMVPRLIQLLRALSQGEGSPDQQATGTAFPSHEQQAAAWHLSVLLLTLGLVALILFFLRSLPVPLAQGPVASQTLPRDFGRAFAHLRVESSMPLPVLLVSISGRRRHLGLCLALATLAGLGLWGKQEILGWSFYGNLGFDAFQQLWPFRALVSLGTAGLLFLILAATPIGAWLTPPKWRQQMLARTLREKVGGNPGPVLVWRRSARQLALWHDAQFGPLPKTYESAFERLIQDAAHGYADQGLAQFQKQAERFQALARADYKKVGSTSTGSTRVR